MKFKIDNIKLLQSMTCYGMGHFRKFMIFKSFGYNSRTGVKYPLFKQIRHFDKYKQRYILGDLLKEYRKSVLLFSYSIRRNKAMRLRAKLPCRGQNTKTNGKTIRKLSFF